jgi:hypothetical protein
MPTRRERRRAEQRKEQGRIWGFFTGIAMSVVPALVPRIPGFIVTVLAVLWLASWRMARDGYKYRLSMKWVVVLMLLHGSILAAMGYLIWPRITVSPVNVSFRGYPNETFNFSVRNGRADDVYDVQIPFLVGYNKHFDDRLSAKVMPNTEPSQPLRDDYNYCYGKKGDGIVSHVQQNEQEVLLVRIVHLTPYGSGSFSITYTGGEAFNTKVGTPDFIGEPYSYSPNEGTVGVRGDYRICKFVLSPNGSVGK